jgi:HAD superfamily hydrolase (TIGR01509 family)
MANTAVLVDLDGTLVDSNYQHALAWWRAFHEAGHPLAAARLHKLVGMGGDQLLDEVLGRHDDAIDAAQSEHFRRMRDEVTVLPGATELLRALAGSGIAVVLATSSSPDDVAHMRGLLGADEWIAHEVNASDLEATKPAPDVFAVALERAGVSASDAIVLGDTGWDIEAAARCDVPAVAVTTGGWSRLDLEHAGAVAVYEDAAALLDGLADSPLARLGVR